MNCLSRTANVISSTTSFHCITKSLHVFTNITSQADLTNRRSVRGGSVPRNLGRNSSNFCIHPEKLRQIIKEKDGQMLCNFFDSEDYKRKVTQISQRQKQLISQGTPIGTKDDDVKYEHVLSCAQPIRRRREYIVEKPDAKVSEVRFRYEKHRVPKKITIMSAILKKKNTDDQNSEIQQPQAKVTSVLPVVRKTKLYSKDTAKKYRKISTILPIYLKKIEKSLEKRQQQQQQEAEESKERHYYKETAKKVYNTNNVNFDKQVLNVRDYETSSSKASEEIAEEIEEKVEKPSNRTNRKPRKERYVDEVTRKGAIFYPELKLVEYSDYMPKHLKVWPTQPEQPWPPKKEWPFQKAAVKEESSSSRNNFKSRDHSDNEIFTKALMDDDVRPESATKNSRSEPSTQSEKVASGNTQVEQVKTAIRKQLSFLTKKLSRRKIKKTVKLGQGAKENLPAISEFEMDKGVDTTDLNKACKRNMSTYRLKQSKPRSNLIIDDVLMLYEKVKIGTTNEPLPADTAKYPFEKEISKGENPLDRSPTYKVVANSKWRRAQDLRQQFETASAVGKDHFCIEVVNTSEHEATNGINKCVEEKRRMSGRSSMDSSRKLSNMAENKDASTYADVVKENREWRFAKKSGNFVDLKTKLMDVTKDNESRNIEKEYEENMKLGKRMMRPPTPFVDFAKKEGGIPYTRRFHRLLRVTGRNGG